MDFQRLLGELKKTIFLLQCLVHGVCYMMVIVIKVLMRNVHLSSGFSLLWSHLPCPSHQDEHAM